MGFGGADNIFIDPEFFSSSDKIYTLTPTSPCIDAGTTDIIDFIIDDAIDMPDMGAFEYD